MGTFAYSDVTHIYHKEFEGTKQAIILLLMYPITLWVKVVVYPTSGVHGHYQLTSRLCTYVGRYLHVISHIRGTW